MDDLPPVDSEETLLDTTPKAALVIESGPGTGQRIPLHGEMSLGRDRANSMVFLDKKVSRHHAKLIPIDTSYIITDLGSSNGTFVNSVRIGQPVRLYTGDLIRLGDTELKFFEGDVPIEALRNLRARPAPPPSLARFKPRAPILDSPWLKPPGQPTWLMLGCGATLLVAVAILIALVVGLMLGQNFG